MEKKFVQVLTDGFSQITERFTAILTQQNFVPDVDVVVIFAIMGHMIVRYSNFYEKMSNLWGGI